MNVFLLAVVLLDSNDGIKWAYSFEFMMKFYEILMRKNSQDF